MIVDLFSSCLLRSVRWLKAAPLALLVLSSGGTGQAANIVYFRDSAAPRDQMAAALAQSGHTVASASDGADFEARLDSGQVDLAVLLIERRPSREYERAIGALAAFVSNGGRAIYADWTGDSTLAVPFDVSYSGVANQTDVAILDSRLVAPNTSSSIKLANRGHGRFAEGLAALGSGTVAAIFANGDAAAVFSNHGRSLVLGMGCDAPADPQFFSRAISALLSQNPAVPSATTGPVTNLSSTGATLTATVNPSGSPTSVLFQYGTDGNLDQVTSAVQIGSGLGPVAVQTAVSGLLPHTTYGFRVRATNSAGVAVGSEGSVFTNLPPVAVNDVQLITQAAPVMISLVANDSDPDSDTLTVTAVTQPAKGTVTLRSNGSALYTPGATFDGTDSFFYEVRDAFGGISTARATIGLTRAGFEGRYLQLLGNAGVADGVLSINTGPMGSFSGTLLLNGIRYSFLGALNAQFSTTVTLKHAGTKSLTLVLGWSFANGQAILTGSVGDGTTSWAVDSARQQFGPKSPHPLAGRRYTLVLPVGDPAANLGQGWGQFAVSSSGSVLVKGRLGDNRKWSCSSAVLADGTLPLFFAAAGSTTASLGGTLRFEEQPGSDVSGTLRWTPRETEAGASAVDTAAYGSRFIKPTAPALALKFANPTQTFMELHFSGVPLASPVTQWLKVGRSFVLSPAKPPRSTARFSLDQSTGLLSGSTAVTGLGAASVSGVVVQKTNTVQGLWNSATRQGRFDAVPSARPPE